MQVLIFISLCTKVAIFTQMKSEQSKVEATEKELKDLSTKNFDPKIKASIDKKLKYINKPVKK